MKKTDNHMRKKSKMTVHAYTCNCPTPYSCMAACMGAGFAMQDKAQQYAIEAAEHTA